MLHENILLMCKHFQTISEHISPFLWKPEGANQRELTFHALHMFIYLLKKCQLKDLKVKRNNDIMLRSSDVLQNAQWANICSNVFYRLSRDFRPLGVA